MQSGHPPFVRTRLSAMMFLTFFIWGSWGVAITGYASFLGFEGWQIGLLGAVPAIGAIISPLFVGLIADRFFAAQRILCVLHVLGGVCLVVAGMQRSFPGLIALMMLNGLLFMPTLALGNSVVFRHLPDPTKFPRIAVLGTVGWIVALLIASVFLGGEKEPKFLFQAGVAGIVLGLYCLTLPHTPPKGGNSSDLFGLGSLSLLKESTFLIFTICVFLVSLPACGYFFTLQVPMLQQRGYPSPLALTTLNQISEFVFMFSMPWFVARIGLKRVVAIGMAAWGTRYLCFACPDFYVVLVGLILHGFCYSFFYVGAYMFFDQRAPQEYKASAQSLVTFLLVGMGMFLGANGGGMMMQKFPAPVPNMAAVLDVSPEKESRPLPPWEDPNAATSAWRYLDLSGTVKSLLSKNETSPPPAMDLAARLDANKDQKITMTEVKAVGDQGLTFGKNTYTRDELVKTFKKVADVGKAKAPPENDVVLDRKQWLAAQSCDWSPIWAWPAVGILVMLGVFLVAFRDKPKTTAAG